MIVQVPCSSLAWCSGGHYFMVLLFARPDKDCRQDGVGLIWPDCVRLRRLLRERNRNEILLQVTHCPNESFDCYTTVIIACHYSLTQVLEAACKQYLIYAASLSATPRRSLPR